jgi:hypothetical protein
MSDESPASILFDELGNPVGVWFDGSVYRLQVQALFTDGYGNGPAAVTPPFTAATAAEPGLVVSFSPNTPITTTEARPSTNTTHSIPASVTSVTLLLSNSARLGATIYNDSSSVIYIKLGTVASLTDFTIRLFPYCYYEIPFLYTGEIDGFWVTATGNARVGELSP